VIRSEFSGSAAREAALTRGTAGPPSSMSNRTTGPPGTWAGPFHLVERYEAEGRNVAREGWVESPIRAAPERWAI
jgi:hypothetical protein